MNRRGEVGAFALQKDFRYALCDARKQDVVVPSPSLY
jgi:N4-(beta-N-acetylglucosaminyl)-L-asparaginase